MEYNQIQKNIIRNKRALRVRQCLRGCEARPRLSVFKSSQHLYVQLIDDQKSKTLASFSTLSKEIKGTELAKKNKNSAKHIGLEIAKRAKSIGIDAVIFDRGRFKYHGIVAAIAEGAREGGLQL